MSCCVDWTAPGHRDRSLEPPERLYRQAGFPLDHFQGLVSADFFAVTDSRLSRVVSFCGAHNRRRTVQFKEANAPPLPPASAAPSDECAIGCAAVSIHQSEYLQQNALYAVKVKLELTIPRGYRCKEKAKRRRLLLWPRRLHPPP